MVDWWLWMGRNNLSIPTYSAYSPILFWAISYSSVADQKQAGTSTLWEEKLSLK